MSSVALQARHGKIHRSALHPDAAAGLVGNTLCGRFARDMTRIGLDEAVDGDLCWRCWRGTDLEPTRPLLVTGHGLVRGGAPFTAEGRSATGRTGHGRCSCGETSPVLESNAARKRWHADHKADVSDPGENR